jgi:hypothetical protein
MPGQVVPFRKPAGAKDIKTASAMQTSANPKSATERIAEKETKLKALMLAFAKDVAAKVYRAVLDDTALRLHDRVEGGVAARDFMTCVFWTRKPLKRSRPVCGLG